MKIALIIAVLLQIGQAVTSSGLTRSLAELTAFVLVVVLVLMKRESKKSDKPLFDLWLLQQRISLPQTIKAKPIWALPFCFVAR